MTDPNDNTELKGSAHLALVRTAVADYMVSEGCSCCQNKPAHDAAAERLAQLLDVPTYPDGSGFNFYQFKTRKP